jgi:hypothetical protein
VAHALAITLAVQLFAGAPRAEGKAVDDAVARWLAEEPQRFGALLKDPARFRLQILVAEVIAARGGARLERHGFRVDAEYFYPASAIKLCAAAAALAKLGDLRRDSGRELGPQTPLWFGPLTPGQSAAGSDARNPDGGRLTFDFLLRAALTVSDNDTFNRLYDFVGQDELNERMWRAGLSSVRLRHRLEIALSEDENRRAPAVELRPEKQAPLRLPARSSALELEVPKVPGLLVGTAHVEGERRLEGPKDFSRKSRIALADLQNLLVAVLRPDIPAGVELGLTPSDRRILARALGGSAKDLGSPAFVGEDFAEARFRPALSGVARVLGRARVDAFGKSGLAFGFQVENAYFVDKGTGRSFFLAAAIYANADGVVGDGLYDYDSVSRPFLADLGEVVARRLWRGAPDRTSTTQK